MGQERLERKTQDHLQEIQRVGIAYKMLRLGTRSPIMQVLVVNLINQHRSKRSLHFVMLASEAKGLRAEQLVDREKRSEVR